MGTNEEEVKLQIAIRCARAANLLSSLRNRHLKVNATINKADDEKETTKREIGHLKVELVRERLESKKIQLLEVALLVAMVLFVSSFTLMIVLKLNQK